jgi:surface antigen
MRFLTKYSPCTTMQMSIEQPGQTTARRHKSTEPMRRETRMKATKSMVGVRRYLKPLMAVPLSAAIGIGALSQAAEAQSPYRVFGTGGIGVGIRLGSPTGTKVAGPGEGATDFTVLCQTPGPSLAGSTVWDQITWRGTTGFIPDAYLWTGYDAYDPRLARCGTTTPAPASSQGSRALAWAKNHLGQTVPQNAAEYNGNQRYGMTAWGGWCETFAYDAWHLGAGYNFPASVNLSSAASHANSVQLNASRTPPAGALVFWSSNSSYGHVAIATGTAEQVVGTLNYSDPIKSYSINTVAGYRGWYLPA